MSADNGIYITSFPTKDGGKEWRVIETTAIENTFDSARLPQEITDLYRAVYYADAKKFKTEKEALEEAWKRYNNIMSSDFPVLEHGISKIEFDRPLPEMTREEASKKLYAFLEKRNVTIYNI